VRDAGGGLCDEKVARIADELHQFLLHWSEQFPACEATQAMLEQWSSGEVKADGMPQSRFALG